MKGLLIFLSVLTVALIVYFFMPVDDRNDEFEALIEETPVEETLVNQKSDAEVEAELALRQEKEAVYEKLEKARRNLDRSLARLKSALWNVRLPPEEAEAINRDMMSAYSLLRNKKLLGAFKSLEQLQDELTSVEHYHERAKQIIEEVKKHPSK